MPNLIDFLDDYDAMIKEVLEVDELQPIIRMQGRARVLQTGAARKTEASIILSHFERSENLIREATIFVGTADSADEDACKNLQGELEAECAHIEDKLGRHIIRVQKGRWNR